MTALLTCPKCKAPLPSGFLNTGQMELCLGCKSKLEGEIFPAYFRKETSTRHEAVGMEDDAACFYHHENKASVVCDSCGRFVCALCDVELKGSHLCPVCLESGFTKGKIKELENKRMLYDNLAIMLALVPLVAFWPATLVTAPAAIYYSVKGWKKPGSIIPRTKIRFIAAILIASAQIAGWLALLLYLVFGHG